jgi:cation:H+ antiporter
MTRVKAALHMQWQHRIAAAVACAVAGVLIAFAGARLPPLFSAAGLAVGILGASMLLAWAADAAEVDLSGRLVILGVALVAVLPELTVEVHLAFTRQAKFVTANITGATRLLLTAALAMPALGALALRCRGEKAPPLELSPQRRLDFAVLAVAALWSLFVNARARLTFVEGMVFGALYLLYVLRGQGAEDDHPAAIGVAAGIASLDPRSRKRLCAALFAGAAVAVFITARAFPDELLRAGTAFGFDPYLLIQWVIPVFTEAPELIVAAALVLHRRPAQGVALLLAASVMQSTLVFASVSFAFLLGGGGSALPLDGRERVEMLLTSATTLMAVAALASLKPKRLDGWIVAAAFVLQTLFPGWPVRLFVALALLVLALDVLASEREFLRPIAAALPRSVWPRTRPPPRRRPTTP